MHYINIIHNYCYSYLKWPWPDLVNDQSLLVLCSRLLHHRGNRLDLLHHLVNQSLLSSGGFSLRGGLPLPPVLLCADCGWGLAALWDRATVGLCQFTYGSCWPTFVVIQSWFGQRQGLRTVFFLAVSALSKWGPCFLGWGSSFPTPVIPGRSPQTPRVRVGVSALKFGRGFPHPC